MGRTLRWTVQEDISPVCDYIDLDAAVLSVRQARGEVDGRLIEKGLKVCGVAADVDLDRDTVAVRRWKVAQLDGWDEPTNQVPFIRRFPRTTTDHPQQRGRFVDWG
ncbi:MAG TPA: hypothetical protein VF148_07020 [Acidimicrobiia bacterium]